MPLKSYNLTESNIFEERAEHLSREELNKWTATSHKDKHILGKLKGTGAKVLSGPRGCGKSTYLRRAYFELLDEENALPIYINYSHSMALEPLFANRANALLIFRQWLLHKILFGMQQALYDLEEAPSRISESWIDNSRARLDEFQTGAISDEDLISIETLRDLLVSQAQDCGRKRVVLLMDDAAHVFSEEQQREFFEVFRQLRSREISPKAAVYPGVTRYSKSFQLGHEAEAVEAWHNPESEDYLKMMRQMVELRFPKEIKQLFKTHQDIVSFLAYCSFGIPRGFINMLSIIVGADENQLNQPNRTAAIKSVKGYAESTRQVYLSLAKKIPRFKNFIDMGSELEAAVIEAIQDFNKQRKSNSRAIHIAIKEPISNEVTKVIQFLEYAGIFRRTESLSKGEKGTFQRFSVHYAFLISGNALSLGKSYQLSSVVEVFSAVDKHAFVRRTAENLIGINASERCKLNMPVCTKCGAERISEEQRFCANCGSELANVSIYNELLSASVKDLPLTENKIQGILRDTNLKTVQDVLNDESSLAQINRVGPYWQSRIKTCAEEFVSV